MKVLHAAFLKSCFGFAIFWRKNIGAKGPRKMLMKLTQGQLIGIGLNYPQAGLVNMIREAPGTDT